MLLQYRNRLESVLAEVTMSPIKADTANIHGEDFPRDSSSRTASSSMYVEMRYYDKRRKHNIIGIVNITVCGLQEVAPGCDIWW
jgi:hypothetical protein